MTSGGRPRTTTDIRGTSKDNHCISDAGQNTTGTYLGYVGNRAIENISHHWMLIISDVIRLKGKSPTKQTSFCVSISNESDMNKVFHHDLWPLGVVVRPFRPSNRQRGNKRFRQYQQIQNNSKNYKPTSKKKNVSRQALAKILCFLKFELT